MAISLMKIKINKNFDVPLKMYLYLPSTLDRKEKFMQWKDHVHLHPIDVRHDDLIEFNDGKDISPALLDNKHLRKDVAGVFHESL